MPEHVLPPRQPPRPPARAPETEARTRPGASETFLRLDPVSLADVGPLRALLDQPHLSRQGLTCGLAEHHRVVWTPDRRTFAVRMLEPLETGDAATHLVGMVELYREPDDDLNGWELSVILDLPPRQGLGGRCAVTALFYAFDVLGAESVWFWARDDQTAALHFARQLGFVRLHALRLLEGVPAAVHELDAAGWDRVRSTAFARHLEGPLLLRDERRRWCVSGGRVELVRT